MKPTYTNLWALICPLIIFQLLFSCNKSDIESQNLDEDIQLDEDNETPIVVEPIACDECTYVVNSWKTDGEELNIKPGDIICLDGNIEYNNLLFTNIKGTSEKPIIIKNCDGKVAFVNPTNSAYGVKFQYSNNFKFLGNGGGGDYGIKVSTEKGFFISMQTFTTDFEIANIEVTGKSANRSGFAGIGIKTSPYEDCDLFRDPTRTAWIMKNIIVRDNYIHDVDGEGLYIGHGFYNGRTESDCTEKTYSHAIKNVRIFNNKIENTGYDGIQIKNSNENVAVYNNFINGYGKKRSGAHDEGLYIGDGTTGKFYNNLVIDGGTGIQVHGMGNLDIYNNVIIDAYDYAFFGASGTTVYRFPDGYFNIFNNTFHSTGERAFAFFSEDGGVKRLNNNIFVAPNATEIARKGATLDSLNNIFTKDLSYAKFVDFDNNNLKLSQDSPLIDAGSNLSDFGLEDDINGVLRPQGKSYDIGAYEYKLP